MNRLPALLPLSILAALACNLGATATPAPPTATPISNPQSPISLRVEPSIPADLGDRVTGPATVFVDAPGAIRVEVYAAPVDGPFSDTPIGEEKLIGADDDASDGFALPWPADEPGFSIKLYALAYLPGDEMPLVSPPVWVLLDWLHATATAQAMPPADRGVAVDVARDEGSGNALDSFMAVQGAPGSMDDAFETQAWADLQLSSDSWPLLNDRYTNDNGETAAYFGEGGIFVVRSAEAQTGSGWRGPFGPRGDLWLDVSEFERYMNRVHSTLGLSKARTAFGLGVTPRALWCPEGQPCPPMDNFNVSTFPADLEEWRATMAAVASYLGEQGYTAPLIEFFTEPESYFTGRNRAVRSFEASADHAELYVHTQWAMQSALPGVKLAAPCHASASNARLYRDVGADPDSIPDTADWLDQVKDAARNAGLADFTPSAICWQGYSGSLDFWDGANTAEDWDEGLTRLNWGAEYVRRELAARGFDPDVPQSISGWNFIFWGTVYDWWPPSDPPPGADYQPAEEILRREAAYLTSQIIDWVGLARSHPGLAIHGHYYTWNLDTHMEAGVCETTPVGRQSLVQTIHGGGSAEDGTEGGMGCYVPPSDVQCKRETYRAFEALRGLSDGRLRFVEVDDPAGALRSLSTLHPDGRVQVLLTDRNAGPLGNLYIAFQNLPVGRYLVRVRSVTHPDPDALLCAEWDETALSDILVSDPAAIQTITFSRNDSGPLLIEITPSASE